MNTFYRIPSAGPLTKLDAYREAKARFHVHHAAARRNHQGIVYVAFNGQAVYVTWDHLPKPTKY